jgi:hypothetical protein
MLDVRGRSSELTRTTYLSSAAINALSDALFQTTCAEATMPEGLKPSCLKESGLTDTEFSCSTRLSSWPQGHARRQARELLK